MRQAKREQMIKQSGALHASRKLAKSMQEQGISEDAIRKALESPSAGEQTPERRLARLQSFQRSQATQGGAIDKKTRDRLASVPVDEEGVPKGIAGQAVGFAEFADDLGSDPTSEQSNLEFMTPSERREFSRGIRDMSRGGDPIGARRISKRLDMINWSKTYKQAFGYDSEEGSET
jgi:hypothetical protein